MNTITGLDKMRSPFPANQVGILCRSTKKDNPKGKCSKCGGFHGLPAVSLDYVGHAAITDRLLDADPSWTWEPLAFNPEGYPVIDNNGGIWIRLTVCGVTRLGYGDAGAKTGGDAMKERIGDAIRNAAMRFGAALDLWHKGELHAPPPDEKIDTSGGAEVHLDSAIIDKLEVAQNIVELKRIWQAIDVGQRHAYKTVFGEARKRLEVSSA